MRYFSLILLLGFMFLMANNASAQKGPKTPPKPPKPLLKKAKMTIFEGTIKQKPWTKSTQSFCAQGSEYYVLVMVDETETVIQNESGQDMTAFIDKKVKITGKIETKTIKPSHNPAEQRPVSINPITGEEESFKCTVLIATKLL